MSAITFRLGTIPKTKIYPVTAKKLLFYPNGEITTIIPVSLLTHTSLWHNDLAADPDIPHQLQ